MQEFSESDENRETILLESKEDEEVKKVDGDEIANKSTLLDDLEMSDDEMPSDYETHDTDEDVLSCTCCYVVEKLMPKVTELKMETEKTEEPEKSLFFSKQEKLNNRIKLHQPVEQIIPIVKLQQVKITDKQEEITSCNDAIK